MHVLPILPHIDNIRLPIGASKYGLPHNLNTVVIPDGYQCGNIVTAYFYSDESKVHIKVCREIHTK